MVSWVQSIDRCGRGINFITFDSEVEGSEDAPADIVLNVLLGIGEWLKNGHRFFLEGKLGLADSPDFKATAGWTFFH